MDWLLSISLCLLSASQTAMTFNVDPTAWKHFSYPATGFGYRVIQNDGSLLVSAPLEQRGDKRGQIYQCQVGSATCSPLRINVPDVGVNMSLGLSMTKDAKSSNTVVCGPTITKECKSITTLSGMCFKIRGSGAVSGPVPSSLRDCTGQTDIAFLLDGSGSVARSDFTRMKTFVTTLIENLIKRDSQFAIAQYSYGCKIHVNFNNFNTRSWKSQVDSIVQVSGGTYTATAIQKLVRELFTDSAGARPKANKILLVITDGLSNDPKLLPGVVAEAEKKNIIRYAIGVGSAFSSGKAQRELNMIASDPDKDHMFRVDDFEALDKIKDTLEQNIIAIEGTQTSGDSTEMELAQDGFSVVLTPQNNIIMGAVGAFQWKGGYQEYPSTGQSPAFRKGSNMEPESYLGYSMAVAMRNRENYIIQGAPRYKHRGMVMIFSPSNSQQRLELDNKQSQIGSYYGAEVCVVDLDSDSTTDLLLVSAPMYTESDQEGKVFVYRYSDQTSLDADEALVGVSGERGRFGTSLASLADLNGDGFSEVAVGAPLEDGGQGSVYIFNGKRGGVNPAYSQRIVGSSVRPGLQFFGLTVSPSAVDQSRDALPDVAVGSRGAVLLLRSRPVVSVETTVSYKPSKIPTSSDCPPLRNTATMCFTMRRHTRDNTALEANINYTLTLDAFRQKLFRATFTADDRVLNSVTKVALEKTCVSHAFTIQGCPEDVLNPLSNELSFTFEGSPSPSMKNLSPALAPQTKTTTYHPLDFEIDCGTDNLCEDNLKVDFNFGSSYIKVGIDLEINVTVSVENRGENSYNTQVILTYPTGLSYRKYTMSQSRVECDSRDTLDSSKPEETFCHVNKPIFKSNSKAVFVVSYGIDGNRPFDQMVTFKTTAVSGNDKHSENSEVSQEKKIGVKYSMFAVIKRLENTTNSINFTAGKSSLEKPVMQIFEVENLLRGLNLTVIIWVPIKLGDKDIWTGVNSIQIPDCDRDGDQKPTHSDFVEKLKKQHVVDCSVAVCRTFKCSLYMMRNDKSIYFISGNVSSGWIEQTGLRSAQFDLVSTATLDYDRNTYIYVSSESLNTPPSKTIETHVEVYEEAEFTKEIIGGAVGGLLLLALITAGLYKAGFFKSQYKQRISEAGGEAGGGGATAAPAE